MGASENVVMYRVTLKDASGRVGGTATTVVVPDGIAKPEKPAKTLYRFRVRTADGTETVSPIAVGLRPVGVFTASELRWGAKEHEHGGETTIHATVSGDEGRPVRFVVEHNVSGSWEPYATVPATVSGDHATAVLAVHHPAAAGAPAAEQSKVKPARLRFKVELGEARPHAAQEFSARDLRWESQEHDHGDETTLRARVSGHGGRPVRFVVEHNTSGSWEPYATVPATVKAGHATARLRVHHPVLPPSGKAPDPAELRQAKPSKLRFRVEPGEA